jgi:hypothetical protein
MTLAHAHGAARDQRDPYVARSLRGVRTDTRSSVNRTDESFGTEPPT